MTSKKTTSTTSTTSKKRKEKKIKKAKKATKKEKKQEKSKSNEKKYQKKEKIIPKTKGWIGNTFVESILRDSEPYFLCFNAKEEKIQMQKEIKDKDTVYVPLEKEGQGYDPYSYTSKEIAQLISKPPTRESLLEEIKKKIDRYLVLEDLEKDVVLGDVLLSYYQEWINTVHYLFFVGDNESGKSSCSHLFRWLGYRALYSETISVANIYNFLGKDEEGAGIIVEDEAHHLDYQREKLRIYKNGYSKGSRIPKIFVGSNFKRQEFYKSFCFKVFSGEYLPKNKGFRQRSVVIKTIGSTPKSNIKELTPNARKELLKLRNKLLFWKVKNAKKGIKIIDSGFEGRNKELWNGFLSCVFGTDFYLQCNEAAKYYVQKRKEEKSNSIEAIIFRKLLEELDKNFEVVFIKFWNSLTQNNPELPGTIDPSNQSFYPTEHKTRITYNYVASILEEKFKGLKIARYSIFKDEERKEHKKKLTSYKFTQEIINRLKKQYFLPPPSSKSGTSGQRGQLKISE
ncbi:MAG: hypothetical protein GWN01_16235 [Nitrosopumilaceae archaeon]|nr:hypothetical protein [Nitrosopumilaceae archaeon]NIU02386.1 hypothetical protein [Nitrosopumilaceae archaeon]NIU88843.1 hypothetical protein [Nitrosopumilaceae archaeon]NIV66967.1 hypothetical protein [Nitrosopumilaceae archaeon]NIX62987.1 hypothetical protein [Nitrosopumilaceae archaeon]